MVDDDERPAGPLLDALGVTVDIGPNQQLTEALIIGKIVDFEDNVTGLVIGASEGLDWVAQRGLVSAAQYILDQGSVDEG